MSLAEAAKAARMIETIENFAVSDNHDIVAIPQPQYIPNSTYIFREQEFWIPVLESPESYWRKKIELKMGILSDWVPRVPGLYWAAGASELREQADLDIASEGKFLKEYYPPGKTQKVEGGIGTYLFPPDNFGNILMSFCCSGNSSVGLPVF